MRVNKAMLMIRLVNRITAERDYWKEKVEAQLEGKPFVENERYERRKHKIIPYKPTPVACLEKF